jgi:hypothetical protein
MPATALAQVAPTVIDETAPAFGRSAWTYQDLSDPGAAPGGMAPKYEGGYAEFDDTASLLYTASPHGGYDTTTNKCKVCHAVHRAEGAYYLLRADSQDDACDYCHIGGSAHSPMVVYDLNAAGKYTPNGHTIGACATIPDSSVYQEAVPVTLSSFDCETGVPMTEDIEVRSYDAEKNSMYRFSRHHAQNAAGSGRSGYLKIGPLALRCMNCHQPHNATNMVWRPYETTGVGLTSATRSSGYKLLRLYPSGSTTGAANIYGYYDAIQAIKVPETTLTAGFNYSQHESAETTYDEFSDGTVRSQPVWVAQHIGAHAGHEHGSDRDGQTMNTAALSAWCADCHNLNIGGFEMLANPELGFKAHTERTHPAPFSGAYDGPGQCYSCHRNDLPTIAGNADIYGVNPVSAGSPFGGFRSGCTQCHFGTVDYQQNVQSGLWDVDFPHSGRDTDHKLLGSYSIVSQSDYTSMTVQTISDTNLDAVCLRCHPGIGVHN